MINHQPVDAMTDETSQPVQNHDCQTPVEKSLWRALREARRERDEARLEVCQLLAQFPGAGASEGYAEERGWQYLNACDAGK